MQDADLEQTITGIDRLVHEYLHALCSRSAYSRARKTLESVRSSLCASMDLLRRAELEIRLAELEREQRGGRTVAGRGGSDDAVADAVSQAVL